MDLIIHLITELLHFDKYIEMFIQHYGILIYVILFLIIFFETGIVFTPFLPGDSIIFAAAAFAAIGSLHIFVLVFVLLVAAILGDASNYFIGQKFGERISKSRFVKKSHLDKAHQFYEKYGGKAITIARFVPIVRTFAPFIAGIGEMKYTRFLRYNFVGAVLWVGSMSIFGYFFGNIPVVKENFSLVTLGIIALSIVPVVVEFAKVKFARK